jgi:N-methylhydantoinase B
MSVVFHRLGTINKEMGITMMRTSRSPIFAEVHDFSCAICDWVPRIVAQVDGVPSHTASSMMAARAIVEKFRDEMKPGDVYLINDPYEGGTHLADVTVVKPIYYQGELLFMAINRAHHLDIGGMVAGSYSPEAREIFHEGLRIPAIRVYEKDEPIQYIIDLLKINTRMPDLFESDIRAQVASCNVAERRERVKEILDGIQVYAEQMMRAEIAKIPDGLYEGEAILDDDGFDRRDIKVKVTIKVEGDEMWVDFDGTDPQTTGFINSPFANSCTSVYVAVLTCVSLDVPSQPAAARAGGQLHAGYRLRGVGGDVHGALETAARPRHGCLEPLVRPGHLRRGPAPLTWAAWSRPTSRRTNWTRRTSPSSTSS